ncbi:patatin [Nocardia cyriacigeorgica]|uniref:Patatin n=1 Tax=Nocardia cyriacigeorgica TaxID=135487 RepID=A0A6P1CH04_9NOCA|nr:patatin-like phospholipase family protein [Nocardia cyriacigeorgica]MBF6425522.1 patatin-like phospholipase family protein [Nocardia cyriacigeorgica]NEW31840.1 patatin [Nocardia cyriacigeorgica]BDT85271.1 patatin family protein [Nocardia cyriacigeorgica]
MSNNNRSQRRGLAIGCGGTLGFAWIVAALDSVSAALDWDPRTADVMIGTSAGAEMVTMLGSGIGVDELVSMQRETTTHPVLAAHLRDEPDRFPPLPRLRWQPSRLALRGPASGQRLLTAGSTLLPVGGGDASWLQRLADGLADERNWVSHPAAWLVGMDAATGERVPFGAPHVPAAALGAALRASWAIPGWFPPVTIDGRRFVDGGAGSTASVDLLAGQQLDEVIVLAPMASVEPARAAGLGYLLERQLRDRMSAQLAIEIEALRAAGTRVLALGATAEDLAVMGPNFMDGRRRRATFEHSLRSTRRALEHAALV